MVIRPFSTPKASSSTLTIGTKQLVVHEALDTTLWAVGVERVVVDADHEGGVGAGGRGRDDHARGARLEVGRGLVAVGEEAGGLDDDVDAEVAPRQLLGVALGEDLERVAVDLDAVVGGLRPRRRGGRVTESYLSRWAIVSSDAEVVDGDEVDVGPGLLGGPEEVAADAAEAVDADADGHADGPLCASSAVDPYRGRRSARVRGPHRLSGQRASLPSSRVVGQAVRPRRRRPSTTATPTASPSGSAPGSHEHHVGLDAVAAQGRDVGGHVEARGLAAPRPAGCRRRPGGRGARSSASRTSSGTAAASTLVKSEPGPSTTWSAAARAAAHLGRRRASAGSTVTRSTPTRAADRHLADDLGAVRGLAARARPARRWPAGPRRRRPVEPDQRPARRPPARSRPVVGQAGDAAGCRRRGPRARRRRSGSSRRPAERGASGRPAATRQRRRSPGAGMPRPCAQPAARAAVVGRRHDRGDVAGVAADGPERGGEPVAAADRRRPVAAAVGRRVTCRRPGGRRRRAWPWLRSRRGHLLGDGDRAVAAAGAAEGDRQVRLALGHEGGQQQVEQVVELVEERRRSAAGRARSRAPGRRAR